MQFNGHSDQAHRPFAVALRRHQTHSGSIIGPAGCEKDRPGLRSEPRWGKNMEAEGMARADSARDRAPSRVIIEGVSPEVDSGRFPIKRTVGEEVAVLADIFTDGHDVIVAVLRHRLSGAITWDEAPLSLQVNDRW